MAAFEPAYAVTEWMEGGYANVAFDYGLETYAGISRRFNPSWPGWAILDRIKLTRPIKHNEKISDPVLIGHVKAFYRDRFLNTGLQLLHSQEVANIVYDFQVLAGKNALKLFQETINGVSRAKKLIADGIIGQKTISAANALDAEVLHDAYKASRENYHRSRVQADPEQIKFLKGWLARNDMFPDLKKKWFNRYGLAGDGRGMGVFQHEKMRLTILLIFLLVLAGCNPFNRLKRKYGKLERDTVQVPYLRNIPPDSTMLQVDLSHLIPGQSVIQNSDRSRITINTDKSGRFLTAQAYSFPLIIRDSIPYPVERVVFNECDFEGYISKKEAAKLMKDAEKHGVLLAKAKMNGKKPSFLEKIGDLGIKFFLFLFVAFIIFMVIKEGINRAMK